MKKLTICVSRLVTIIFTLLLCFNLKAQHVVSGKVMNEKGAPLEGVTVSIKDSRISQSTDNEGRFRMEALNPSIRLIVKGIGFKSNERQVVFPLIKELEIVLVDSVQRLQEVIVSTGYQAISKERATGSFVQLPNELLNRRASTDILSRLEDAVPGLSVNREADKSPNHQSQISIRGQNTISGRPDPLIVIDNFPYDGGMENINPNDVESITILKDAAAASIWGAKAGNGVIVINTKRGLRNQETKVSFQSNATLGEKPDLFYPAKMSIPDFIEMESYLFSKGYFSGAEKSLNQAPLSPVVEMLIAQRDGNATSVEADSYVNSLKTVDFRKDLERHFYRSSKKQQHQLSLSGGGNSYQYYFSGGYDRNIENVKGASFRRITLNANNSYFLLQNNLKINTGISLVESRRDEADDSMHEVTQKTSSASIFYPYARLLDETGNSLPLIKEYRRSFVENAEKNGLLNWEYRPADERNFLNQFLKTSDLRVNIGLSYKVEKGLNVDVLYQYQNNNSDSRHLRPLESYYVRDMVNKFTQVNVDGSLVFPVPRNSILNSGENNIIGHNARVQLNYFRGWEDWELNTIVGYEIKDLSTNGIQIRRYGYDDLHALNKDVDYLTPYPYSYSLSGMTGYIQSVNSEKSLSDRFLSYYSNGSLLFKNRFMVSASARFDQSNLFGVKANNRGVPLWSSGISWIITNEPFFHAKWVSNLKLRATYGSSGSVNRTVSAYVTAAYNNGSFSDTKLPYAQIGNPPNPQLRWEQVRMFNLGIDFSVLKDKISGTIELYKKHSKNLIGSIPKPSSSGVGSYSGNFANTRGHGIDFSIITNNLNRRFKWQTHFLYSRVKDIVTKYNSDADIVQHLRYGYSSVNAVEGRPLHAIYSYAWAGLNPQDGSPQGYSNNVISSDYSQIINNATLEELIFNGSARPTSFGSIRNIFAYRGFSIAASVSYRLGYYFRSESVRYNEVLTGGWGHGDYAKRWKTTGDELKTTIPSIPEYGASNIVNRDNFYNYSDLLVEKGDHVRLQDIKISYRLNKKSVTHSTLDNIEFYMYADNLGLLWKSSKREIDPDFRYARPLKTITFGATVNF